MLREQILSKLCPFKIIREKYLKLLYQDEVAILKQKPKAQVMAI
jgi:hypothetical protein